MNILDFPETELPDGDFLREMFDKQHELIDKYHEIETKQGALVVPPELFGEVDNRRVQWRIKDLAYRCVEELSEATNTLKNKPWKTTEVETDRNHFYEELSDALHFFLELCITAGIDAEDLILLYLKKHKVNQFRQRSGY